MSKYSVNNCFKKTFVFCLLVFIAGFLIFFTKPVKLPLPKQQTNILLPTSRAIEHHSPPITIIEQGSGVETASYIIFKDDEGIVYAKNGSTGAIDYSGTNTSAVIQSAINQKSGAVFIKKSLTNYLLSASIIVKENAPIWSDGAVLQPTSDIDVFGIIDADGPVEIKGLTIKDVNSTQASKGAIYWDTSTAVARPLVIRDLYINNTYHGIYTQDDAQVSALTYPNGFVQNIVFKDVRGTSLRVHRVADLIIEDIYVNDASTVFQTDAVNIAGNGLHIKNLNILGARGSSSATASLVLNLADSTVENIIIDTGPNNAEGVRLNSGCTNLWIKNVDIIDPYGSGLRTNYGGGGIYINGLNARSAGDYGIRIYNTANTRPIMIEHAELRENYLAGISVEGTFQPNVYISDSRIGDDYGSTAIQPYAFDIQNNGNVTITNNDVGNNNGVFNNKGSGVTVRNNVGFVTENSGNTTVANNDWFAHGLAATPKIVTLTTINGTYDGVPVVMGAIDKNSTHVKTSVYWTNGTAITTTLQTYWYAEV